MRPFKLRCHERQPIRGGESGGFTSSNKIIGRSYAPFEFQPCSAKPVRHEALTAILRGQTRAVSAAVSTGVDLCYRFGADRLSQK